LETDETFWLCKVNPKFVELIKRLVVALERTQAFTGQLQQEEKSLVRQMAPKGLLTVEEAANRLGISKCSLRNWVSQRRIPYVKIGRRTLFNPTDLENLIKASTVEPLKPSDKDYKW
jgi:excisionase family DNA binding protein